MRNDRFCILVPFLLMLSAAPASAKRMPAPIKPLVGFNVLRVVSGAHANWTRRAIVTSEETSRALTLELILRGQTEGAAPTLVKQLTVQFPATEARRFGSISWEGAFLTFQMGNPTQMTHICTASVAPPKQANPRPTRWTEQLKPRCKPLGNAPKTKPLRR